MGNNLQDVLKQTGLSEELTGSLLEFATAMNAPGRWNRAFRNIASFLVDNKVTTLEEWVRWYPSLVEANELPGRGKDRMLIEVWGEFCNPELLECPHCGKPEGCKHGEFPVLYPSRVDGKDLG